MKILMLTAALLLSTVPLLSIATTTEVHAQPSQSVVIAQIDPGIIEPTHEVTVLYNAGSEDVDVTNWCIEYSAGSNGQDFRRPACIETTQPDTALWLQAGGLVSFASGNFLTANPSFIPDVPMVGGYALSSGHIRLVDAAGQEIDRVGWGSATAPETAAAFANINGYIQQPITRDLSRPDSDNNSIDFIQAPLISPMTSGLYEKSTIVVVDLCQNIEGFQEVIPDGYMPAENTTCFYDICPTIDGLQKNVPNGYELLENGIDCVPVDVCSNLDDIQFVLPEGYLLDEEGLCQQDACPNIVDLQVTVPDGLEQDADGYCIPAPVVLEDAVLHITELYPNAPSFDTGQEYIELYNPNVEAIELAGYTLQLGPALTKTHIFSGGTIAPGEYVVLSDLDSGLVLPNTTAFVQLVAPSGDVVSQTAAYDGPNDDETWALIDGVWQFTDQITPAAQNQPTAVELDVGEDEVATESVASATSVNNELGPCPEGKFRNPATNRCKTIESATSQLVPCREDQFRNPETNRCKAIETATTSGESVASSSADNGLVPCREDQYRNPETNRCKKLPIDDQEVSLQPCDPDQYRNPETNRCKKLETASSTLTPCREGQFRNPETNRCKSIATASSQLVPCSEGQERNPETNRCRKVQDVLGVSTGGALPAVTDVAVASTDGAFNWLILVLAVVGVGGYITYEWRHEIIRRCRHLFLRRRS